MFRNARASPAFVNARRSLLVCCRVAEGEAKNWLDEAILVNPRIVAMGKGKVTDEEGCLSFPGMRGQVRLPPKV